VTERRWAGSWLSGQNPAAGGSRSRYPGEAFGLPEDGPRSVAGIGRRLVALIIDWGISAVIAYGIFGSQLGHRAFSQFGTLAVFAVMTFLLTAVTGFTIGKRLLGVRVARLDGRPVGFGWSALRVLLLLLVVPPLVLDHDLRGLHDRAAGTVVIRI
jgi:uncharacterized RDD family membrane protein YckC